MRKAPGSEETMRRTGGTGSVTRDKPEAPGGSSRGQVRLEPEEWGGGSPIPPQAPLWQGWQGWASREAWDLGCAA